MSTQITYKGNNTNVDNQTKTMLTAGKYLEDDITITDTPRAYTWMGDHAEFLSNFYTFQCKLSDTNYPSWTPTTTATSILATTNCQTFVADLSRYEYVLEWLWDTETAWPDGQTMQYCPVRNFGAIYQTVMRRPYGLDNLASDNWNYAYCTSDYTASCYLLYYNANKSRAWTTTQYGVYASAATAAAFSSTSSDTPTVTPKRPVISARCNSSYFTTTRAGQVDQDETTIKVVGNLYRIDKNTSDLHNQWAKAVYMYNNPL